VRILALECATVRCSAAVWQDGVVRAHAASDTPHGATELLVPMLSRVMAQSAIDLSAMDRLAITVGPGHFTGLRAGLAVARGLVLATGIAAVAVTTLEAVAAATAPELRRGRHVLAAIDSKRAEPYLQIFDAALDAMSQPMACPIDDFIATAARFSRLLVAGDAGPPLADTLRRAGLDVELAPGPQQPDAAVVASLAAERPVLNGKLRPFYLHPPAVKLPAAAGGLS
jgi:tRNA threonylcarbamoyladenosine biosynthesis protein TsaB